MSAPPARFPVGGAWKLDFYLLARRHAFNRLFGRDFGAGFRALAHRAGQRDLAARALDRRGVRRAVAVTGGVITSAGVVLAATFSALWVIPLLFLAQIAFIVAFGVLLDTIVTRSVLVPALAADLGNRIWWPGSGRMADDEPR